MNAWNSRRPVFETDERGTHLNSAWEGHRRFAYDLVCHMLPGRIVELGTYYGASHFAFCQAVKDHGLATECYAVDTWLGDKHTGLYDESLYQSVQSLSSTYYPGISHLLRMTFDEALHVFPDSSINLLHIDGLHTYEAVKHDYESWLPKLADQGVILFHDIAAMQDDFGVYRYWEDLQNLYYAVQFEHSFGLGFGGMALLTASMLVTGFNENIYFMVGFLSVSGIGIGVVLPCMDALITEGIEKENRGTITSLYSSMRFIGVALGPPVVSLLMNRGHWTLFGTMAGVGAVGGLLSFFVVTPSKEDLEGGGQPERSQHKPKKANPLRQRAR